MLTQNKKSYWIITIFLKYTSYVIGNFDTLTCLINKQIYEIYTYLRLPSHFIIVESWVFYFTVYKIYFNFDCYYVFVQ